MTSSGQENHAERGYKYDLDFKQIHDLIRPADVRPSDRVIARLRKRAPSDAEYVRCQVWKLSPLGVELVYPSYGDFQKGDSIDIEITISGERSYFEGLIVDLVQANDDIKLIGIRLSKRSKTQSIGSDRRRSPRWICNQEFFPTAVAPGKIGINDSMRFQVRDISRNGLQLTCSLRNKFLLPGMSLALAATFPEVGELLLRVRIVRIDITSEHGKDQLVIGTEFVSLSRRDRKVLGQYLIQFSDVESLEALRENGFEPHSVSRGVEFYFLKSEHDYKQVLELRLLAHLAEGTMRDGDLTADDMGDINDARARILIGKYNGRVIVTGRLRINDGKSPLEHEAHISIPRDFPRRDQIQEVSRLCTHPEFRKSDLLISFFHFICSSSFSEDRPWYLMGSWESMVPFYVKIGFRKTGLQHGESLWRRNQVLLIGNAVDAMLGRSTDPIYWNLVWRHVSDFLVEQGALQPNRMDRVRISALKAISPFAKTLWWYRRKPRAIRKTPLKIA
jgi:hypothetical protein